MSGVSHNPKAACSPVRIFFLLRTKICLLANSIPGSDCDSRTKSKRQGGGGPVEMDMKPAPLPVTCWVLALRPPPSLCSRVPRCPGLRSPVAGCRASRAHTVSMALPTRLAPPGLCGAREDAWAPLQDGHEPSLRVGAGRAGVLPSSHGVPPAAAT